MRCGDCKHWKRLDVYLEADEAGITHGTTEPSEFGRCVKADGESFQGRFSVENGTIYKDDITSIGDRNAATCDGSGYYSALITRDRFGCVDFEASAPSASEATK